MRHRHTPSPDDRDVQRATCLAMPLGAELRAALRVEVDEGRSSHAVGEEVDRFGEATVCR
jgi:hypothetical protein